MLSFVEIDETNVSDIDVYQGCRELEDCIMAALPKKYVAHESTTSFPAWNTCRYNTTTSVLYKKKQYLASINPGYTCFTSSNFFRANAAGPDGSEMPLSRFTIPGRS
jgi:hypothetical protein